MGKVHTRRGPYMGPRIIALLRRGVMTRTVWMMSDRASDQGKLPGQGRHSRHWRAGGACRWSGRGQRGATGYCVTGGHRDPDHVLHSCDVTDVARLSAPAPVPPLLSLSIRVSAN